MTRTDRFGDNLWRTLRIYVSRACDAADSWSADKNFPPFFLGPAPGYGKMATYRHGCRGNDGAQVVLSSSEATEGGGGERLPASPFCAVAALWAFRSAENA